jgi:hypothetical protein
MINSTGTSIGKDSKMELINTRYLLRFDFSDSSGYRRCVESCPTSESLICKYGIEPAKESDLAGRVRSLSESNTIGDSAVFK